MLDLYQLHNSPFSILVYRYYCHRWHLHYNSFYCLVNVLHFRRLLLSVWLALDRVQQIQQIHGYFHMISPRTNYYYYSLYPCVHALSAAVDSMEKSKLIYS